MTTKKQNLSSVLPPGESDNGAPNQTEVLKHGGAE